VTIVYRLVNRTNKLYNIKFKDIHVLKQEPYHEMEEAVKVQIYTFLTSVIDRGQWTVYNPVTLPPEKQSQHPLDSRRNGAEKLSEHVYRQSNTNPSQSAS
jgi:hypothetical protein